MSVKKQISLVLVLAFVVGLFAVPVMARNRRSGVNATRGSSKRIGSPASRRGRRISSQSNFRHDSRLGHQSSRSARHFRNHERRLRENDSDLSLRIGRHNSFRRGSQFGSHDGFRYGSRSGRHSDFRHRGRFGHHRGFHIGFRHRGRFGHHRGFHIGFRHGRYFFYYGSPFYRYRYYRYPYYYSWPYSSYYDYRTYYYDSPLYESDERYRRDDERYSSQRAPENLTSREAKINRHLDNVAEAFAEEDYVRAVIRAAQAVRAEPDDTLLQFVYAQSLFARGQFDRSAKILRQALRLTTTDSGEMFFPLGFYTEPQVLRDKIDRLREAVEKDPERADIQLLLGYQLLGIGRFDEAQQALQKADKGYVNKKAAAKLMEVLEKAENTEKQPTTEQKSTEETIEPVEKEY